MVNPSRFVASGNSLIIYRLKLAVASTTNSFPPFLVIMEEITGGESVSYYFNQLNSLIDGNQMPASNA